MLVAELDAYGQVRAEYVWGQLGPVARIAGGRVQLYVCDALGHVRALIDAETGQITDRYDYDAWGNVVHNGSTRQPFTWNGAYGYEWMPFAWDRAPGYDDTWRFEIGLYHVGARAYDPRTARWLQRDPIDAASGDPNLYRYCGNDPINGVDPSGTKQPCIKTLVFTGDTLKIFDEKGDEIMRIAAYSGLPGTTAADQNRPNVGPIPEGTYWIDPSEIVELSDDPSTRWPGGSVYEPNLDSWGRYRVPLRPDPATNTHGRSGFYLHGGTMIGSQGCIDVGSVNDNILRLIKEQGCRKVKVVVKYPNPHKPVPSDSSQGSRGARPWRGYRHAGPD